MTNAWTGAVAALSIAAAACVLSGCGATTDDNKTHTVVYTASGTVPTADLTYTTDGSTSTEQQSGAKLPWTKTYTIKTDVVAVYQLMVQNSGTTNGKVTCEIKVDNKVVKTATSSGMARSPRATTHRRRTEVLHFSAHSPAEHPIV